MQNPDVWRDFSSVISPSSWRCWHKPPPCSSRWRSSCSFRGCTSLSSPAEIKTVTFCWPAYLSKLIPPHPTPLPTPLQQAGTSTLGRAENLKALTVKHLIIKVIISKLPHICNPSITVNNLYRWLLFISAIRNSEQKWEIIMTYHGVFKYLPQVIVIMRNVIIGCGNEPPELVAVCYVHEDSLQHTGETKISRFRKSWKPTFLWWPTERIYRVHIGVNMAPESSGKLVAQKWKYL